MLMRDFNLTAENKNLEVFMSTSALECMIRKPASFQSAHINCIDESFIETTAPFK